VTGLGQATPITQADVEAWLSPPRLNKYLGAAGGNLQTALELYVWNSRVAAAALADTCHLEVALRNAYDGAVIGAHPSWGNDLRSTLFAREQGHPQAKKQQKWLNEGSNKALDDARRSIGVNATHGQVVAGLSFGFWVKFTDKHRESTFWTPYLYKAFPSGSRRGDVHQRISNVARFRNRLAHNEPVFSTRTGLRSRLGEVHCLLEEVAPPIAPLVAQASNVKHLLPACPVAGLV
jgi:hypothetical protein